MKKIAMVSDYILGSGLTQYALNIVKSDKLSNLQFIPISISGNKKELIRLFQNQNTETYCIEAASVNIVKHLKDWWKTSKIISKKCDVIYFNISATWNFLPLVFAKINGAKVIVVHAHANYYRQIPGNQLKLFFLNSCNFFGKLVFYLLGNHYFACSTSAAKWVFPSNIKAQQRVKIIKNAVDFNKFEYNATFRKSVRENFGCSDDDFVIGHVGGFMKRKNQILLIQVTKKLIERGHPVKLLLVGNGSLKEYYEKTIYNLGIKDSVILIDNTSEVGKLYNAMDLFAFPSITEGLGLVAIEAQVNGLPVVLSPTIPLETECLPSTIRTSSFDVSEWTQIISDNILSHSRTFNAPKIMSDFGYDLNDLVDFYNKFRW